jgi:hypothetical protein
VEIARWFYSMALREARTESSPFTWAALLRAAQNLRYAIACLERATTAGARRDGSSGPPFDRDPGDHAS